MLRFIKNLFKQPICLQIEDGHHKIIKIKEQFDTATIVEMAGFLPNQKLCIREGDRLTIRNKFHSDKTHIIYEFLGASSSDDAGKIFATISPAITEDEVQKKVIVYKRVD